MPSACASGPSARTSSMPRAPRLPPDRRPGPFPLSRFSRQRSSTRALGPRPAPPATPDSRQRTTMTKRQAPQQPASPTHPFAIPLVMAAALAVCHGHAMAQAAPDAPRGDEKPAAKEPQPPADSSRLETVTVTSNRRLETAQKVSGVVQSVSGDQLRKDGITEVRQLQAAVPGLSIANQEGNVEIFIRGVGSANNTQLGDPGAAPHLNGVYIPRPRGLGLMFYHLERVEVNKGPQGTLYGRNA